MTLSIVQFMLILKHLITMALELYTKNTIY